MTESPLPIGVFDSGMGGLTVLRALQAELPGESFIYLGHLGSNDHRAATEKLTSLALIDS